MKRSLVRTTLSLIALLALWIVVDLSWPSRRDIRVFDAHQVAQLETRMWRSYYEQKPLRLFTELTELMQRQYGMPFWRARLAGYHAARAATIFQPGQNRTEYLKALPDLECLYTLVQQTSAEPFDVRRAAALELGWWIAHRERGDHLQGTLAELQAEIYFQPATHFGTHAAARADAMRLRDTLAGSGRAMSEADWQQIGDLLERSWTDLRAATAPATLSAR